MSILGVDPGPAQSGWCLYRHGRVLASGVIATASIGPSLFTGVDRVAIEMVASYGMPVGREVFETCVWIGRLVERAERAGLPVRLVYRGEVKLHLCQSLRAKDPHIRQALLDRLGAIGTKAAPGPLYGVKGHAWAALAVALFADEVPEPARAEALSA